MNNLKEFAQYVFILIVAIILGITMLIAVSLIPKKFIEENIKISEQQLYEEGKTKYSNTFFKQIFLGSYSLYNNNATDAIMLNNVYSIDRDNIIDSILKVRRNYVPGVTKIVEKESNGNLSSSQKYDGEINLILELRDTINQKDIVSYEYSRYWHGYIVILNILLVFLNFTQIKILMTVLLLFTFLLLSFLIYKRNPKNSIMFVTSFIAMNILSWGATFQGILVLIIAMLFSLFIAFKKVSNKTLNKLFFCIGILTAYFDFFTTPLITLLLPLLVLNIFEYSNSNAKYMISKSVKNIIAWSIGYGLFWCSKWIIIDIVYGTSVIKLSILQAIYRMNETGKITEHIYALKVNLLYPINILYIVVLCISIIKFLYNTIKYGKRYIFNSKNILYYIYGIIPILWFLIFAQHSKQHFDFTYKTGVITLLCIALSAVDIEKEKK